MKDTNEWWRFQSAVDEFNEIHRTRILSGFWMIVDETMSAYRPRTSATGKLPNISYIFRKPEPLGKFFPALPICFSIISHSLVGCCVVPGTEFKSACCPITGVDCFGDTERGQVDAQ